MTAVSETSAETMRRAAKAMRERPEWHAVAAWLESLDGIDWAEHGSASEEFRHALNVAHAYIGGQ